MINGLLRLGPEVIYESMYDVHVSGHACQEEQKLMLTLAKPQFFIPVHGEYKHLKKHAQTAIAVVCPSKTCILAKTAAASFYRKTASARASRCRPAPFWWTASAWATWAMW